MPVPGQLDPMWEDAARRQEVFAWIDATFPVRTQPLMPVVTTGADDPTPEPTGTRDSGDEDPHA